MVLVEAISVIVRIDAIADRYPGGWESFRNAVPNQTLCADSHLARVGFMSPSDVGSYVEALEKQGLVFVEDDTFTDIAVADQQSGFTNKCEWAEFGTVAMDGYSIKACRAINDETDQLMTPDGWHYEGSLSHTFGFAPTEHMDKSLQFLRHKNGLDVYLNTLTGKEVYIGRTGKR